MTKKEKIIKLAYHKTRTKPVPLFLKATKQDADRLSDLSVVFPTVYRLSDLS